MNTIDDLIARPLADLGATDTVAVSVRFAQAEAAFVAELGRASKEGRWEDIRDRWMRPQGQCILDRIDSNWVQSAPATLRQYAQLELQRLRAFIGIRLFASAPLQADTSNLVEGAFNNLRIAFDKEIAGCTDATDLGVSSIAWLGRTSGVIKLVADNWLKPAKPELKRAVGQALNELKAHVEAALESRRAAIEAAVEQTSLAREREDLSLPGVVRPLGSRHPLRQTFEEIERIFLSLGYSVVAGPEMETPYYNFEALNIPEHHPARDNMDTFYMAAPPGAAPLLLRTHTSPMQVRTMEKQPPPVRIIVPGKVYRRDNPDATHGFMFNQIEGLAVDTDITFCDFKGTVEYFVREFLGPKVKTRLRPSYFPFTEPSVEVDATCVFCGGKGCNVCKQSGWIELFGAGMVDPAVYGFVNYDAKKFSGFAFGMGVERLTQLKYNINDLQLYFQNDVRFLRQFA
jgi:phenylalanyl-tRNA synthetase alpha chain